MTNIIPSPGYVLVQPQKKETTTASGILLSPSNSEKPQQGVVIAVGGEMTTDFGIKKACPCAINDQVIYREWGGKEYKDGENELLILKFDDIMAIVAKETAPVKSETEPSAPFIADNSARTNNLS